jgi:hypothetical protein
MWALFAVGAAAATGPDRMLTGPTSSAWSPAATRPVPGRSGRGVALIPDPDGDTGTGAIRAVVPVIVTHEDLRLDLLALDPWPVRVSVTLDDPKQGHLEADATPSAAAWSELRLGTTDLCGASGDLALSVDGGADDALPVYVDRIRMTGDVCPQFRDADGDGRCTQGYDLDGDGLCVSADEPLPRPALADCNDTSPGPRCLTLAIEPQGQHLVLTATGAEPGEAVWFFASGRRGQSCPPALGGVCMDLAAPRQVGHVVADDAGQGRLEVPLVDGTWFQAGVMRLGQSSDLSPVAELGTPAVQPDPITDR